MSVTSAGSPPVSPRPPVEAPPAPDTSAAPTVLERDPEKAVTHVATGVAAPAAPELPKFVKPRLPVRLAGRALEMTRGAGAHMLGAVAGGWHKVQHAGLRALKVGARGKKNEDPLWQLFRLTQQSKDRELFRDWLKLNGFKGPQREERLAVMQRVAAEIIEATKPQPQVMLVDHNLPLLHPFAHDDREIFAAYLDRMTEDGTWASGTEARALADALKVRIAVYQPLPGDDSAAELQAVYGRDGAKPGLHIQHNGGGHWEGIVRRRGTPLETPLGEKQGDQLLQTAGDGNCLFHAVQRTLRTAGEPAGYVLSHHGLRSLAVQQMRAHPDAYMAHVRREVDVARSGMEAQEQDEIDARAVQAVIVGHAHRPWDATWAFLARHVDDVQSFNGAAVPTLAAEAMEALIVQVVGRMRPAILSGALNIEIFLERLASMTAAHGTTVDRLLGALSPWQRAHLLAEFRPAKKMTLEQAEAASGPLFKCLAFLDIAYFTSAEQLKRLMLRALRDPQRRLAFIETLACEFDATRRGNGRERPLSRRHWEKLVDAKTLTGARDALVALYEGLPKGADGAPLPALRTLETSNAWQPAKWVALYRFVVICEASRDAWLVALREASRPALELLAWALSNDANARGIISKEARYAVHQCLSVR